MNILPSYKRKYARNSSIVIGIYAFLSFFPFCYVLLNMFKKTRDIQAHPFTINKEMFTLDSIEKAFKRLNYFATLKNNIIVLVLSLTFMLIFGSLLAYALVRSNSKIASFLFNSIVMMLTLPIQLAMIPLVGILAKLGLYNTYLGMACVFASHGMPFTVFLFYNGMKQIPKELVEAANIDGCGFLRTYFNIYMPLIKGVTGTVIITRSVAVWNDLLITMLAISESKMMTLPLKLNTVISQYTTDLGLLFAGTVQVIIPIVIVFLVFQKSFMRNVAAGSIKG